MLQTSVSTTVLQERILFGASAVQVQQRDAEISVLMSMLRKAEASAARVSAAGMQQSPAMALPQQASMMHASVSTQDAQACSHGAHSNGQLFINRQCAGPSKHCDVNLCAVSSLPRGANPVWIGKVCVSLSGSQHNV